MQVIIIDSNMKRLIKMSKAIGSNGLRWANGKAIDANGKKVALSGSLAILCHVTPLDLQHLKRDPLLGVIGGNQAVVVYYSGNPTLEIAQNLLSNKAVEVVRRAISETHVLTSIEAEELKTYCERRLAQLDLSSDHLERIRPEFLRRVPRSGFLQVLKILCEGFLGAPPAAWQVVRTHQWWLQGLGIDNSELLAVFEASWPLPDLACESARAKAKELLELLRSGKGSIEEPIVRAVYEAVGQRLRPEG
jgi:hypothetical protein